MMCNTSAISHTEVSQKYWRFYVMAEICFSDLFIQYGSQRFMVMKTVTVKLESTIIISPPSLFLKYILSSSFTPDVDQYLSTFLVRSISEMSFFINKSKQDAQVL